MNLSKVAGKFCKSPIFGLNSADNAWVDLGVMGALQTYDRFISERSFGQKKRVLTVLRDNPIPEAFSQIRVGDYREVFLVETYTPDIAAEAYELIYSLRIAKYQATLIQLEGQTRLSGISAGDQETTLETIWIDLEKFGTEESRQMEGSKYGVFTASLPAHSQARAGLILAVGSDRYRIEEVYPQLDLPTARVIKYV